MIVTHRHSVGGPVGSPHRPGSGPFTAPGRPRVHVSPCVQPRVAPVALSHRARPPGDRGTVNDPEAGNNAVMRAVLGLDVTTAVLVVIAGTSVLALILIVVAPWRRVREEPPLDPDVETRLLLHRPNPEEETGELPTARVRDLDDRQEPPTGDFAELRELDDQS